MIGVALWGLALAGPAADCQEGDASACIVVAEGAAARILAASTDEQPVDPRYLPGLEAAVDAACKAGDAGACQWTLAVDDPVELCERYEIDAYCDPLEPETLAARYVDRLVLPLDDGWVPASRSELGRSGRWFPYAAGLHGLGDALVVRTAASQFVRIDPDGAEVIDLGPDVCGVAMGGASAAARVGADCDRLRFVDLRSGEGWTRPWPEDGQRTLKVGGPFVAVDTPEEAVRIGPDGETRWSGGLREMSSDGAMLLDRDPDWVRVGPDGTETVLAVDGRGPPHLLRDGAWLVQHQGRFHVFEADGSERGWFWDRGVRPFDIVETDGGLAILDIGASVVVGDAPVTAPPDWAVPHAPKLRSDRVLRAVPAQVVDPEGEPVAGAWIRGVQTDADGRGDLPTTALDLFVDGIPRRGEWRDDTLHVLPSVEVVLPEGVDKTHVMEPWQQWLGVRTAPHTYQWRFERPSVGETLVATVPPSVGGQLPDPVEAIYVKPEGDARFVALEPTELTVVDTAGAPLPGLEVLARGPFDHVRTADLQGRVVVWSAERRTVTSDGLELRHTRDGDRLVVQGVPAEPQAWTGVSGRPLLGPWRGEQGGQHVSLWLLPHRLRHAPPGLLADGLDPMVTDGTVLLWPRGPARLRREVVEVKNTRRWFTGVLGWAAGDTARMEVTLLAPEQPPDPLGATWTLEADGQDLLWTEVRDDGRTVPAMRLVQGVFAGLADPEDRYRTPEGPHYVSGEQDEARLRVRWADVGGILSGVQLRKGVPWTEDVWLAGEPVRHTWTYEGRARCGAGRCALLSFERTVGGGAAGKGELLIDPATLRPYRFVFGVDQPMVEATWAWSP